MTTANERPFHIVVGFDFSELGKLALAEALGLAGLNPKTAMHIVGVVDSSQGLGPVTPDGKADFHTAEAVQEEIKKVVEEKGKKYEPGDFQYYIHARIGHPAREILNVADEADADLIVLGTHGRSGVRRLVMGSVAEVVVRHAPCPVLVMRPKRERAHDETTEEQFQPEPPCPACEERRTATDGAEWWCEAHGTPHAKPHHYSYSSGTSQTGNKSWSAFNQ